MPVRIVITRNKQDENETLGTLQVITDMGNTMYLCKTLELPWKNNANRISCIPNGNYSCRKVGATANIPYDHIAIDNIPKRSGVCIHSGNLVTQILGCILVGSEYGDINKDGIPDILNSRNTLKELLSYLPNQFQLILTQK